MWRKKRQATVRDRFLKIREATKSTKREFQGADTVLRRFTKERIERKELPSHLPPPFKKEFSIEKPGRKRMIAVQGFLGLCTLEMVFIAYPYCLSKLLLAKFPVVFHVAFFWFCNLFELQGVSEMELSWRGSVFWGEVMCFKGDYLYHMCS